jgi:DNA-binding transcriptional LysR family regulator
VTTPTRIDWNLLPVLDALLTERNVSRAARRLGISQPAASGALARLRRLFDDELLVREGGVYELTPLALHLQTRVRDAVRATGEVTVPLGRFDPSESRREFVVAGSEYAQAILGAELTRRVGAEAPRARLTFRSPRALAAGPGELLAQVDGCLSPREVMPDADRVGTMCDRWTCVVADDHPGVGGLSLDDLRAYPWVVPTVADGRPMPMQLDTLKAQGVEPRIEVLTDTFLGVPFLVSGSRRIGLVQGRLGSLLQEAAGVRVVECPWELPPILYTMFFHPSRAADEGHAWFRTLVEETLAALDEPRAAFAVSR